MSSITNINADMFRDTCFFSLSIRRFGNRMKVKDEAKLREYLAALNAKDGEPVEVRAVESNGTARATSTTKVLVRSDKLDELNTFLSDTKANLCGKFGKAAPSRIKEGLFVVSKSLVQEFEDTLATALKEMREKYLPAFMDDYVPAIDRARTLDVKKGGLGPLFEASDYPMAEELEAAFGLNWTWLALGVPSDLPVALREAAAAKLEAQFSEAAEEVKDALRVSFQELISHAVERLTPAEDGKPRVFRDSMLTNIQQFLDVFEARNIMRDGDLQGLVSKAQEVLIGIDVDGVRKNEGVRAEARKKFEEIKAVLDPLVETRKGRVFDFSQE